MNPSCFSRKSISWQHICGCLPTCAYIDIDSCITRFSRIRLIFITSFPLGNSKHILITFFYGALDLDASKASRCSAASIPPLPFFPWWNILSVPWPLPLNRAQPSPILSSNASNSRESRSQSIQLCRSRGMNRNRPHASGCFYKTIFLPRETETIICTCESPPPLVVLVISPCLLSCALK